MKRDPAQMPPPLFTTPFPVQTPYTACRIMRGHRFGAIKDGWLLVYEDRQTPTGDQHIGELCIVMTADGRVLTRMVSQGRMPATWDLLTPNMEQELDVALRWAELVTLIIPFKPSPEQTAAIAPVA